MKVDLYIDDEMQTFNFTSNFTKSILTLIIRNSSEHTYQKARVRVCVPLGDGVDDAVGGAGGPEYTNRWRDMYSMDSMAEFSNFLYYQDYQQWVRGGQVGPFGDDHPAPAFIAQANEVLDKIELYFTDDSVQRSASKKQRTGGFAKTTAAQNKRVRRRSHSRDRSRCPTQRFRRVSARRRRALKSRSRKPN